MEMIERVAKAIYEEDDAWSSAFPWPQMPSIEQSAENYRRIAKAAIMAMRDPTEGMVDAGADGMTYTQDLTFSKMARFAWRDMIDAALKETDQ